MPQNPHFEAFREERKLDGPESSSVCIGSRWRLFTDKAGLIWAFVFVQDKNLKFVFTFRS